MKKNVFLLIVLVAVAAVNMVISNTRNSSMVNMLMSLEDVEYLAYGEPGDGKGAPTCAAGGCHASECSFNGQIEVLGNGVTYTNSITCVDAWACCFANAFCFAKDRCDW